MNSLELIRSSLISCRNLLIEGRSNEHVRESLHAILMHLDSITVPSTRSILSYCVRQVVLLLDDPEKRVASGLVLNLIHNLPLSEEQKRDWDIDHFLAAELPSFLDRFDEIDIARSVVLFVCGQISAEYSPALLFPES